MKISELEASMASAPSKQPDKHFVIFLPYLTLKRPYTVAGVEFVPLRDENGTIPSVLASAVAPLDVILSGYVDRNDVPLKNCVVATVPGRGWDLTQSDDFGNVRWAASLLFLASWARNEYFPKFGGSYVNSTRFRVVAQAYSGDMPHYIAFSSRRRDGGITDGGYVHGEVKFPVPLQVSLNYAADVDEPFLAALDAASATGSPIIDPLRTALLFVELANTDDDFMNWHAEAILMGSAFEQLLRGDASSYKLGKRFGELFQSFGSITVLDARKMRPGIEIDATAIDSLIWRTWHFVRRLLPRSGLTQRLDQALATAVGAAQSKWWVHRKWVEELYDVRSKVVHKGALPSLGRQWAWSIFEHLVMAAHVFPLAVKLLLEHQGHYTFSDADRVHALIVDQLLASPQWADADDGSESEAAWSRILSKTQNSVAFDKAWEAVKHEYPGLFGAGADKSDS